MLSNQAIQNVNSQMLVFPIRVLQAHETAGISGKYRKIRENCGEIDENWINQIYDCVDWLHAFLPEVFDWIFY